MRLDFEPGSPAYREGSTPDALVDLMRDAGFELREELQLDHPTEAAFARLAEVQAVTLDPADVGADLGQPLHRGHHRGELGEHAARETGDHLVAAVEGGVK